MNLLCVAASSDLRADEKLQDARSIARALAHPQHGNPVSRATVPRILPETTCGPCVVRA